jgi:hypothetical protein
MGQVHGSPGRPRPPLARNSAIFPPRPFIFTSRNPIVFPDGHGRTGKGARGRQDMTLALPGVFRRSTPLLFL